MCRNERAMFIGIGAFVACILFVLCSVGAQAAPLASGVVSQTGDKYSGTNNWSPSYNQNSKWYEITINGENYSYNSYTTVVSATFKSWEMGYCNTGSVNNKLTVDCHDKSGNPATPVSFSFVTYKNDASDALASGVVSQTGGKNSGTGNWSSSYNQNSKWYEITINGENYSFHDYAAVVTPSFKTWETGYCTTDNVNNKLLVKCFDKSGNPTTPVSFSFISYKKGNSGSALASGVVSQTGGKNSGTGNWSSSYNQNSKWYEITINGVNYSFRDYATVVSPSFNSLNTGYCSTNNVNNMLLISCYDKSGNPATPVSFSFMTYKPATSTTPGSNIPNPVKLSMPPFYNIAAPNRTIYYTGASSVVLPDHSKKALITKVKNTCAYGFQLSYKDNFGKVLAGPVWLNPSDPTDAFNGKDANAHWEAIGPESGTLVQKTLIMSIDIYWEQQ